jgi:hypothetical protein
MFIELGGLLGVSLEILTWFASLVNGWDVTG